MLRQNLTQRKTKNTHQINQEAFYTKKRALVRKAEIVSKGCNADVFIVVHQKDTDKIFSYTSQHDFQLEKISSLVLKDVKEAAFLKRVQKFENTDFDLVQQNISEAQQIVKEHNVNYQQLNNSELINDIQNGENGQINGYTSTADSSKTMFRQDTPSNQPKKEQNISQQAIMSNEISNHQSSFQGQSTPTNYKSNHNLKQSIQPNQLYSPIDQLATPNEEGDIREDIQQIDFCTNGSPQMKPMKNRFKQSRQEMKQREISSIAIETLPGSKSYVKSMASINDQQFNNYPQSTGQKNYDNQKQDLNHYNMFIYNNYSKQGDFEYSDLNKTQQYRGTLFDRTLDEYDNNENSHLMKNDETLSIIKEEPQYQYNVPNMRKNSLQSLKSFM